MQIRNRTAADSQDFQALCEALVRLRLNDSVLSCEPKTSAALGFGFSMWLCGLASYGILGVEKHRVPKHLQYFTRQVALRYELPRSGVARDFFDRPKSVSRGHVSLDYHFVRYQRADLVKLDTLTYGERVEALAAIVHRDKSIW